jgi:hypothetical protein
MSSATSADRTTISYDRNDIGPPVILGSSEPLTNQPRGHHWQLIWPARSPSSTTTSAAVAPATTLCHTRSTAKSTISRRSSAPRAVAPQSSDTPQEQYSPCAPPPAGLPITKLALYDPPFQIRGTSPDYWRDLARQIDDLISAGRDAVELYQTKGVGLPPEVVAQPRQAPFWPALEAIAHSLAYESLILACPPELLGSVSAPTLVIHGEASPDPGSCPRSRRRTSPRPVAHAARSDPRPGN